MITIKDGIVLKGLDLKPVKENILICDGKILEISPNVLEGRIIDANNHIIYPSFLNAHTHLGDSIILDGGDGMPIEEIVKPPNGLKHKALLQSSDEIIIDSMKKSLWRLLKSGTTHLIDYREGGLNGVKLLKEASKEFPISTTILSRDEIFYDKDASSIELKKIIKKLLKVSDGIAPSGFGEISDEVGFTIVEECKKANKISSIHVGEYEYLQNDSLAKFGKTEIEKGISQGFDLLIHLTSPLNNDLDLISKSLSSIVVCPRSNASFQLGLPPIANFIQRGVKPLIGTDNLMTNNPNLIREMEYTLNASKALYKIYISPLDILKMACSNIAYNSMIFNSDSNFNNYINNNFIDINSIVKKTIIEEGNEPQFFIAKSISKNHYLNIINRVEITDIAYVFNKNAFIHGDIIEDIF
ncbi:MAG: amidohydrolase family protein [Methanobrevibacter sp.]|jgi:cytosine/adenosine deaminase-related metal-dependent hydrolase|nr:amidohydrolase family protein [Methanobrevibacter sp.]